MTAHVPTPVLAIPDSAPFSAEQRSWLSGYFSALLSPDMLGATPIAGDAGGSSGPELAENDTAPWHDPSIALPERMDMAKERPLAPRLMAAMAQQDCGQCGYNCADYANALFLKTEERLNLCAPGGKETARMLKALAAEMGEAGAAPAEAKAVDGAAVPSGPRGYCRENPAPATFLSRRRLNGEGSEKETWHVEIDLTESGVEYVVGDSLGVFASNASLVVDAVIAQLGARPERMIGEKPLRLALMEDYDLGPAPDALFTLISQVTGGDTRKTARALAAGEDPHGDLAALDVLGALHKFPMARPDAEAFLEALEPLQPRLYSISSSPKADPGRVTLTVDAVRYAINRRQRLGVASTFFAERIAPGTPLRVYVQKAHGFALPKDPKTPVIMVGPGTGIAPFRAFLRDREADRAPGRNWLFFGHQRSTSDFFYKEELTAMKEARFLDRLTLAWSRDGSEKIYVQDRMREVGADLWAWFKDGAHFYICGDAKRMAKDVETALVDVAAQHGGLSAEEAVAFVQGLKKAGRYQADVY
ncbi:sulfite reductase subunit alpha [Enterovirga rhinocerotis]|uniref:assimilatory sulfite reductase (NADPH) n=1 Tax=Enterovirga rhinocerotis TaxID=1339210 RepID=A0A4V3DWN1_9HYPH|nr:sulfite reductase subunit alpha [Enterovirga rhinocerotis]TDR85499.1 NAD(P)H-dependent nitrite reductase flavoprotein subunit [Enterovirga rhinocerotis]